MNQSSANALRILVTNDDGVESDGIFALKNALTAVGHRVTVCAPDRPRSASGHSITLHKPLRMKEVALRDSSIAFAASGTPADCVTLGVLEAMPDGCDFVVSGINHGPNLGWDLTYSGTVAAAIEATIIGYGAIAVSVASYAPHLSYDPVAGYVARLVSVVHRHKLPPTVLLNVNAPNIPADELKGVRVTVQGERQYVDRIEKRTDPLGRAYYWLGGALQGGDALEGTDVRAVADGYISVTPVHLDMTAHRLVPVLRDNWRVADELFDPR